MNLQKIRGRIIAGEQIHLQRKEFYKKPSNIAGAENTTYVKYRPVLFILAVCSVYHFHF